MQDAKEEVRARLNIEDVIGEYVQLRRVGRNFRGLSPFTNEKTPSFYVSPDKNIWHDFSSNKGGDVFSFIMEVEGMDFRASLEYLARKAGVDLTLYNNGSSRELENLKKRLFYAYELAVNYYQQSLLKNQRAMDYVFKKRGLNREVVKDFNIGYAPSSGDALVNFLKKRGFSAKELSQAGLTNRFGGDIFRARMLISLQDTTGRVIGFTGRVISDSDKKSPKYLNTPQTPLYDKSRHVFGLSQAKEAIRACNCAVIVEGNMDVISSHQVGAKQVVATGGTAMTELHLKALARLTGDIRLAFDGDKAGLMATERAIWIAQKVGVDIKVISMPKTAKDPDELIKQSSQAWQEAIDRAEPAVDWILGQYQKRENLATAQGRRNFTSATLKIVKLLKDSVEQEYYLQKIATISQTSLAAVKTKFSTEQSSADPHQLKQITHKTEISIDPHAYQDDLLAVALVDTAVQDLLRTAKIELFDEKKRQAVAKYIAENVGKVVKDTPEELQNYDIYVKMLLLKADARYAEWNDQDRYFEAARLLRQVANENLQTEKNKLIDKLRDAETLGDDDLADSLRGRLNELIKEIQSGKK